MARSPKKEEEHPPPPEAYRLPDGVTLNVRPRPSVLFIHHIYMTFPCVSPNLLCAPSALLRRSAPSGSVRPRSSSGRSSSGARRRVRASHQHSSLAAMAWIAFELIDDSA